MKKIIDRTRSKRPILVPDENDYHRIHKLLNKVTETVADIEQDIELHENNPEYIRIVTESYERMLEIALKRMEIDVKDTHAHAEIVGQFNERLRLTGEMISAKNRLVERESLLERVKNRMAQISSKLNLTGDDDGK